MVQGTGMVSANDIAALDAMLSADNAPRCGKVGGSAFQIAMSITTSTSITPLDCVFHEDAVKLSGSHPEVDDALNEEAALRNTNALLRSVGITGKPITAFLDLCMSASSMFVAMFEAMFQTRLGGIVRQPQHVCDYVSNVQNVIDALEGLVLDMSLAHIRGEAIVRGDSVAIIDLVDIFMLISRARAPVVDDGWTAAAPASASATGLPPAHHEAKMPPAPATALPAPVAVPTRAAPSPPAPVAETKRKRSSDGDNADDTTTHGQATHGHNTSSSAHSPATVASALLEPTAKKTLAVLKTAAPATSEKVVLPLDQSAREVLDASSKASAFTALAGASIDFRGLDLGVGAPLGLQKPVAAPALAAYGVELQQQPLSPPGPVSAPASYGFEFSQGDGTPRYERAVPLGAPPSGYAPLPPHWAAVPTGGEPIPPTPAAYVDWMAHAAGMASGMMYAGMPAGLVARPQHPFASIVAATQPAPSAAVLPGLAGRVAPAWPGQARVAASSACALAPPKRGGPAIVFTTQCTKQSRHHSRIEQQPWLSAPPPASAPATRREVRAPVRAPAAAPASGPVDFHTTDVYCRDDGRTTLRTVLSKNGWKFQGFVRDTDPIAPGPLW